MLRLNHPALWAGLCGAVISPFLVGAVLTERHDYDTITGRTSLNKKHEVHNNTWLRAFVETGSDDPRVQVTLNEMGAHQSAAAGTLGRYGLPFLVSGAAREMQGRKGVLITVWFNGEIPPDIEIGMTVTQSGAKRFADPVVFPGM